MIKSLLWCGKLLGNIAYVLMRKRKRIALLNLAVCFPELTLRELKKLCKRNFQNVGMGVIEALVSFFVSDNAIQKIPYIWVGKEHYDQAIATGGGVIALSSHMTCVEMAGRIFGRFMSLYCVYKPSRNQRIDRMIVKGRMRYAKGLLKHSNMKAMVSALRQGKLVWFAPDQDFGRVRAEFVPFCGVPAATIVATNVLAKMGNAVVLPMFFHRTPEAYVLTTYPCFENFPTGNDYEDCKRYNDLLTEFVRQYPEQYLWIHRRFKTVKHGANIYCK